MADNHYDYSEGFGSRAAVSLADPMLRKSIATAVDIQARNRINALTSLADAEALRELGSQIRASAIARLDEHLERLAENWEAAGGTVFFAADAAEAGAYIVGVAEKAGATTVVKSKSMASEEIGLNTVLGEAGIEAVETDLGEYIVQQDGGHPSHIVAPAIHKSKEDVAGILSAVAGEELPLDTLELMKFARGVLREKFLTAEVGVSGVNHAVAESGAICIVTNEGNARMCTSMPPVHVAIMGMERVVGTWDELAVILSLLARSATGQKLTQYTSLINGPKRAGEIDGPTESHLVILDNGRSNILGTRYQAALHCIRCGACLNVCPVYRQLGGHAYDPVYSGPIGAVLLPLIKGTAEAGELAHASTLCGACYEACPVKIPLHDLLLRLRQDYAEEGAGRLEHAAYSAWSHAWATPGRFKAFGRIGGLLGRATGGRSLGRLPLPPLSRWTRGRTLPGFPRATFRDKRAR